MATFSKSVEAWRDDVAKHAGDLPVDFLLSWISHESAGNPCATGIPGKEAGIFQTYHPDDDRFGATFAQLRAACVGTSQRQERPLTSAERDRQVRAGVAYVRASVSKAQSLLEAAGAAELWPAPDFYALVKLRHVLPAIASFVPAYAKANGRPPQSWPEFRAWVESLSDEQMVATNRAIYPWRSLEQRQRLLGNAEKTARVLGPFGGSVGGVAGFVTFELAIMIALLAGAYLLTR